MIGLFGSILIPAWYMYLVNNKAVGFICLQLGIYLQPRITLLLIVELCVLSWFDMILCKHIWQFISGMRFCKELKRCESTFSWRDPFNETILFYLLRTISTGTLCGIFWVETLGFIIIIFLYSLWFVCLFLVFLLVCFNFCIKKKWHNNALYIRSRNLIK